MLISKDFRKRATIGSSLALLLLSANKFSSKMFNYRCNLYFMKSLFDFLIESRIKSAMNGVLKTEFFDKGTDLSFQIESINNRSKPYYGTFQKSSTYCFTDNT